MEMKVLSVLLLVAAWSSEVQSASDCIVTIPSIDDPSRCVLYNLTAVARLGPYTLSAGGYEYVFSLCGYVNAPLPKQCSSLPTSAAAYQYNDSTCYALGSSTKDSTYTVSIN